MNTSGFEAMYSVLGYCRRVSLALLLVLDVVSFILSLSLFPFISNSKHLLKARMPAVVVVLEC